MITLTIGYLSGLAIVLMAGHQNLFPDWFVIGYCVVLCFLYFAGGIVECSKRERVEQLEAKNIELEKKMNHITALLEKYRGEYK